MPRVDWIIACRHAEVADSNLLTMEGAGIDRTQVATFPAEVNFMIGVRVVGSSDDYARGRYPLFLAISAPDGTDILRSDESEIEVQGTRDVDWVVPIHVVLGVRFTAGSRGAYRIQVGVADTPPAEITMFVSDRPPDGTPY